MAQNLSASRCAKADVTGNFLALRSPVGMDTALVRHGLVTARTLPPCNASSCDSSNTPTVPELGVLLRVRTSAEAWRAAFGRSSLQFTAPVRARLSTTFYSARTPTQLQCHSSAIASPAELVYPAQEPKGRLHRVELGGEETVTQVSLVAGQECCKHSILVVEDELLLRLDLSSQLRMAGFDVIEADTGDEALRVLANEIDVELVLTDIRMPGNTDGMGLAKWVRRQAPHIKIAILSAYIDPYWDMPVDATFAKPVRIERLLTGLRQLLPPMEQAGSGSH